MKTYVVHPYGFCMGVTNAINLAIKTKQEHPYENVTVLGMLIHNEIALRKLNSYGIKSLYSDKLSLRSLLDEIKDGYVIFTAHGHSSKLEEVARGKGLKIVDAICPFVQLVRNVIERNYDDKQILYIAKPNHPESAAIMADFPRVRLIESDYDIDDLPKEGNFILVNQTTLSSLDLKDKIDKIKTKLPNVETKLDICNATKERQLQVLAMPEDIDLVYVIGDKHSSNTQRLFELAKTRLPNANIKKIATASEIANSDLDVSSFVGIVSGTSTPNEVVEEVLFKLKNY